uniref:Hypocretin neuropeptide precursor n=1 Tax=Esox lucius TaxID=8010 RepID=A0A3P8YRK2_ESOLU
RRLVTRKCVCLKEMLRKVHQKLKVILLLLLVSHLACDAEEIANCCSQKSHSCPLYALLCREGSGTGTRGRLPDDAAAGFLTVGKWKKNGERRFRSRLSQLLNGSQNPAAGILTMGKRTEDTVEQLMHIFPILETSPSF